MSIQYVLPRPWLWVVTKTLSVFGVSLPLLALGVGVPGIRLSMVG